MVQIPNASGLISGGTAPYLVSAIKLKFTLSKRGFESSKLYAPIEEVSSCWKRVRHVYRQGSNW